MPLEIIRNDITKVKVDAIVNAANSSLLGGCKTGKAKITKSYDLPAKYIIHTLGPIWQGGKKNEEELLIDCYQNSLKLAKEMDLKSIAFPLISSGAFGYPKDKVLKTAISAIGDFLMQNDMQVFLVVYDKTSFILSEKLFSSIEEYIDDRYLDERSFYNIPTIAYESSTFCEENKRKLEEIVNNIDETFSEMLFRLIDEKNMSDTKTYKKANVDRKLFSKIRNDINYRPSKPTVIAFAIALELNLDETKDLLLKAGFAFSHSSKFDIIIEYFIEEDNYNIFEINEALFAFEQNLLGV